MFSACQGDLTDEDMKLELLKNKSALGLDLLTDEDDAASSQKNELIGTWLATDKEGNFRLTLDGITFNADGTYYVYDHDTTEPWFWELWTGKAKNEGELTADDLPQIIATSQQHRPGGSGTWSATGNILTCTSVEVDDKGGTYKTYIDTERYKYILSGNTLTVIREADEDDDGEYDKDGDGWEDEAEYILTKYN
ncbi:MAG: hypothetical protein IKG96_02565 [Bacteroidaceae bacterium]|nr:hypothetical protein [Bacteroidaceae bacterium]